MFRRLLTGALICFALAALVAGSVWLNRVYQTRSLPFEQVQKGMTRAEVDRLVGPSLGVSDAGFDYWIRGNEQLHVLFTEDDTAGIVAIGDDRTPPCHLLLAPHRPTLVEKVQRWLGL